MRLNEIDQKDPKQVLQGLKTKDRESIEFAQSLGIPPAVIDKFVEMEQKVDQVQDERIRSSATKLEDILLGYISKASQSLMNRPISRRTFFKGTANFASFIANMDKILSLIGKMPMPLPTPAPAEIIKPSAGWSRIFLKTAGDGLWSKSEKNVLITRIEINLSDFNDNYGERKGLQLGRHGKREKYHLYGEMRVYFDTDTWDVKQHGLIYTDNLWEKQLHQILKGFGMKNWKGVYYSEQGMQGYNYVSLDIDHKTAVELKKHPNFKKTGDDYAFAEFDIYNSQPKEDEYNRTNILAELGQALVDRFYEEDWGVGEFPDFAQDYMDAQFDDDKDYIPIQPELILSEIERIAKEERAEKYIEWIVRTYIRGGFQWEDIRRVIAEQR